MSCCSRQRTCCSLHPNPSLESLIVEESLGVWEYTKRGYIPWLLLCHAVTVIVGMLIGGSVSSVVGIDSRAIPDASVWVWPQWAQNRFVTDITDYPYPPLFLFKGSEVEDFLVGQARYYALLPCFASMPVEVSVANLTIANAGGMGCIGWPQSQSNNKQVNHSLNAKHTAVHLERAYGKADLLDETWWSDAAADAAPLTSAPTKTIRWSMGNPTEALPPMFRTKQLGLNFAQRLVRAEIVLPLRTWDEATPDSSALAPRLGCLQWRIRTVLDASARGYVGVSSVAHLMGPCPGAARPYGYEVTGGYGRGKYRTGEVSSLADAGAGADAHDGAGVGANFRYREFIDSDLLAANGGARSVLNGSEAAVGPDDLVLGMDDATRAGLGWVLLDAATYGAHTGRAVAVAVLLGSAVLTTALGVWSLVQGVVVMLNIVLLEAEEDDEEEQEHSLDEGRQSGAGSDGSMSVERARRKRRRRSSSGYDRRRSRAAEGTGVELNGRGGGHRRHSSAGSGGAESSASRRKGTLARERSSKGVQSSVFSTASFSRTGRDRASSFNGATTGVGGLGDEPSSSSPFVQDRGRGSPAGGSSAARAPEGATEENAAVGPLPVFASRPRALSAGSSATFSVAASSVVGPLNASDLDRLGRGGTGAGASALQSAGGRPASIMRRMPRGVLRRLRTQSRLALAGGIMPGVSSGSGGGISREASSGSAMLGTSAAAAAAATTGSARQSAGRVGAPPAGVLHAASLGVGSPPAGHPVSAVVSPRGIVHRESSVVSSINVGDDGADFNGAYGPLRGEGGGGDEDSKLSGDGTYGYGGGRGYGAVDVRSDIAAGLEEDPAGRAAALMHRRVDYLQAIWQQTSAWDRFQMLRPWLLIATIGAGVVSVWAIAAMLQGLAVAVDQHAHRSHEHGAWATATIVTGSAGHLRWVLTLGSFLLCLGLVHYTEPYPLWFAVSGTIARAWGRILELFAGAGPIFMAYVLLGVAIFGRYSLRFSSSNRSALTLFAFMNGDAMRETFDHVSTLVIGVPEAMQQRTDMNHWGFLLGPLHDPIGLDPSGAPGDDDHFRDDDVGPEDYGDTDDYSIDEYGLDSVVAARHWLPGFLALYLVSFEFFLLYVALNSLVAIAEESFFATRPEGDSALAPTVGGEEGVATVGGRRLPAMLRALLLQVSRDSGVAD